MTIEIINISRLYLPGINRKDLIVEVRAKLI